MGTLFIVTGPAASGKTAVSKGLAKELEKSVCIEGDDVYSQVVGGYKSAWEEGNHLNVFWKIIKYEVRTYLDAGYDVVFNYIIHKDTLNNLINEFKDVDIKFCVLLASEEELLKRDSMRPVDCQMGGRCIVLLNNFLKDNFEEKYKINTDEMFLDQEINLFKDADKFYINKPEENTFRFGF